LRSTTRKRARKLITRLRTRTEILAHRPQAGRPREELGAGLRSLSERPYVLIYRLLDDTPEIIAILHGARDLPTALVSRIEREA
jgi:toxin ParE1/3/4